MHANVRQLSDQLVEPAVAAPFGIEASIEAEMHVVCL